MRVLSRVFGLCARIRFVSKPEKFATDSEAVFAQYLDELQLAWEYELTSGRKHPDFWVDFERTTVVCEVREIQAEAPGGRVGFIDPYEKPRRVIKKKAEQGKEVKGIHPYVIVVRRHHFWPLDDISVPGAMFGDLGIRMPINVETGEGQPDESETVFGQGAMLQERKNRSVSAVAILDRLNPMNEAVEIEYKRRLAAEEELDGTKTVEIIWNTYDEFRRAGKFDDDARTPFLSVFHNPHATLPLPNGIFSGPFDRHWDLVDGIYGPVVEGIECSPV